jgi:hypothetical protein
VTFQERLQELKAYREQFGHVRVPTCSSSNGPYRQLGAWVQRLRRAYKQLPKTLSSTDDNDDDNNNDISLMTSAYKLTPSRIQQLQALNFEWQLLPQQTPWNARYEQLLVYFKQHGHANVPRAYPENRQLGEWVHTQRILYRKQSKVMMGERTTKLQAIGFQWRTTATATAAAANNTKPGSSKKLRADLYVPWEQRYQELVEFQLKFGHLHVPNKGPYELLARWVSSNRCQYRRGAKILQKGQRFAKMRAIGFEWVVNSSSKSLGLSTSFFLQQKAERDAQRRFAHDASTFQQQQQQQQAAAWTTKWTSITNYN